MIQRTKVVLPVTFAALCRWGNRITNVQNIDDD